MESKVKEAVQRKMCGYNCAQAVACTYCEQAGLDEETVKNLTQGFAVGMGGSMEATCLPRPTSSKVPTTARTILRRKRSA